MEPKETDIIGGPEPQFNPEQVPENFTDAVNGINADSVAEMKEAFSPVDDGQQNGVNVGEAIPEGEPDFSEGVTNPYADDGEEIPPVYRPGEDPDAGDYHDESVEGNVVFGTEGAPESEGLQQKIARIEEKRDKNLKDVELFMKTPFVELFTQRTTMTKSLADLEETKKYLDDLDKELEKCDDATRRVALSDAMESAKRDRFMEKYPELRADAMRLQELITKLIKVYKPPYLGSIQFMNGSMLQSMQPRLTNAQETGKKPHEKRIEHTIKAYSDRTDFEILFHKLSYGNNTWDFIKELNKIGLDRTAVMINSVFEGVFNDPNMEKFQLAALELLKKDGDSEKDLDVAKAHLFMFTAWLADAYKKGIDNGHAAYIKTLIMNVYDAYDAKIGKEDLTFDIPGGWQLVRFTLTSLIALMIMPGSYKSRSDLKAIFPQMFHDIHKAYSMQREQLLVDYPGGELITKTTIEDLYPDVKGEDLVNEIYELDMMKAQEEDLADSEDESEEDEPGDSEDEDPGDSKEDGEDYSPDEDSQKQGDFGEDYSPDDELKPHTPVN